MFDQATIAAIRAVAAQTGIAPAALAGIAEVESGGQVYAAVDGRAEPMIRWEGHYFDQRLAGAARAKARAAGLASPNAGGVANPKRQPARWALLARAIEIDAIAAYESCSWGLGQVMGAHWRDLGFGSVTELVNLCRRDAGGQVELMARFIARNGLTDAIRRRDWAAFAKAYNGPAYRTNRYDTKIAAAVARWEMKLGGVAPSSPSSRPTLRRGDTGEDVRTLQRLLSARGRMLVADGDFGARTEAAVRAFQEQSGLSVDGIVGPTTRARLEGR